MLCVTEGLTPFWWSVNQVHLYITTWLLLIPVEAVSSTFFLQGCIVVWKLTVSLRNGRMHSTNPIPHLSLSIGCQIIHFCHIHQFNSIAGQRRPNVTWWQSSHSVVSFLQASLCLQIAKFSESFIFYLLTSPQASTWYSQLYIQSVRNLHKTVENVYVINAIHKQSIKKLQMRWLWMWLTWQPRAALRKVRMVGDTGAAPVIMSLTRPPRLAYSAKQTWKLQNVNSKLIYYASQKPLQIHLTK